jgi:hypothetical protein
MGVGSFKCRRSGEFQMSADRPGGRLKFQHQRRRRRVESVVTDGIGHDSRGLKSPSPVKYAGTPRSEDSAMAPLRSLTHAAHASRGYAFSPYFQEDPLFRMRCTEKIGEGTFTVTNVTNWYYKCSGINSTGRQIFGRGSAGIPFSTLQIQKQSPVHAHFRGRTGPSLRVLG